MEKEHKTSYKAVNGFHLLMLRLTFHRLLMHNSGSQSRALGGAPVGGWLRKNPHLLHIDHPGSVEVINPRVRVCRPCMEERGRGVEGLWQEEKGPV